MNSSTSKWRRPGKEALLLLYWVPHFLWFELITYLTPRMNPHVIYSPLDDRIPFLEMFILPYVLWYFYIAAVQLYFLFKNKKDFLDVTKLLYIALFVSMLVCTLYPSTHELRPAVFPRENLLSAAVGFLYSIDNPTMPACILPSMHVLVSLVLAAAGNGGGNAMVSYLASRVDSAYLYPIVLGGLLILVSVYSVCFLKEKMNRAGFAGLALGIAAIAVMNL